MDQIQNLSHQELLRLIEVYAKNWLAQDAIHDAPANTIDL